MAETANGRNIVIHLKAKVIGQDKQKRTTASLNSILADLVTLKLDNMLAKDASKALTKWAQGICDTHDLTTVALSERIRFHALMFVADKDLREAWMTADG